MSDLDALEPRLLLTAGQNVALYEFTSHTVDSPDLGSSDTHTSSTASPITSPRNLGSTGYGQPPRGLALGGDFNATTEPVPSAGHLDYFQFTVTPNDGTSIDLGTFSLQLRRTGTSPKDSVSVYFDEDPGAGGDNFSTKILTAVSAKVDQFENFSTSLRNISELQGIDKAVTFRVYAWGTQGTGTLRLDNVRLQAAPQTVDGSSWAYYGDSDRLLHPLDATGNRIPDFSSSGYMYGNEPVPDVVDIVPADRIITVSPGVGDDTSTIQAAIDQLEALAPDANGFRGVVQLTAGEFQIADRLHILASGIVLRGVGDEADPALNTVLRGTGTGQRSLINVGAASGFVSRISNTTHQIVDKYVPVGATSFEVDATNNWTVGDEVVVHRPSTAEWITAVGMDSIPPRSDGGTVNQWVPGGNYDQPYERIITRIEGNRIFLNAPITNAIEQQYGGGVVFRYTFPRISHVGIENIRGVSDFASATDEDHAWSFISLNAVQNAWVTSVTGQHFGYATVHATSRSRMVTVDDARSLDPVSQITGARRYPFVIDGQFVLMKNLYSEEGRHDFVNNSAWRNRGPNVFLHGTAVNSHSSTGPHQRWSTGTLYDTIVTDNQIEARNRGNFGSGHGWGGANMVFWNTAAQSYIVQNPPTAQNWVIGGSGPILNETRFGVQPPPTVDAHETPIDFLRQDNPTSSLYVGQWNQRTSNPLLEKREYVLGDYDLAEFDGIDSSDAVFVSEEWRSELASVTGGQNLSSFDQGVTSEMVAGSFEFDLTDNEAVVAAVLTVGLRSTSDTATESGIRLDDVNQRRTLSSLGLTDTLSTTETTPLLIELTGADLERLQDGSLHLAFDSNVLVDWATLDLTVGPQLLLTIDDAVLSEDAESRDVTVSRATASVTALTVQLQTSDESELSLPDSVTIPPGATSTTFAVTGLRDGFVDGDKPVFITATAEHHVDGVTEVLVTDADTATLTLTTDEAELAEVGERVITIHRNTPTDASLVVQIQSTDESEASVPAQVTIPAGFASTTFTVTGLADNAVDGDQVVRIAAAAAGFVSEDLNLNVIDVDRAGPAIQGPTGFPVNRRPDFNWNEVNAAVSYDVRLLLLTDQAPIVVYDTNVTGTSITFPDELASLGVGHYRFLARATFADGRSLWSHHDFFVRLRVDRLTIDSNGDDRRPTVSWSPVDGAQTYELYVLNQSTGAIETVLTSQPSVSLHDRPRLFGEHIFWVRALGHGGFLSPWSSPEIHVVTSRLRNADWTSLADRPEFQWTEAAGAASYEIYVQNGDGVIIQEDGISGTSYRPSRELSPGVYSWWVRPFNSDGQPGLWSETGRLQTTGTPEIVRLQETVTGVLSVDWEPVEGADSYEVYVAEGEDRRVMQHAVNVTETTFELQPLPDGEYDVWVKAVGSERAQWSHRYSTRVEAANLQVIASPTGPSSSIFGQPTFDWETDAAEESEIYLTNGTQVIRQRVDGAGSQQWQPSQSLSVEEWAWWVRAIDSDGNGGTWSEQQLVDLSARLQILEPSGVISPYPRFRWTNVAGAGSYEIEVRDARDDQVILRRDDLTGDSWQLQEPLLVGRYRVWMRAIQDTSGSPGPWSRRSEFEVIR